MNEAEKLTREVIANGGVLALLYFDIHAKEKELIGQLDQFFPSSPPTGSSILPRAYSTPAFFIRFFRYE